MSGQPVKTQAEVNAYRNKYMDTLALQEEINDMNLQANKTYLLTGQLPPQSQMMDTRTNAEKLADVEKLKREIASELRPIAEPPLAYQIVNAVIDSPLNLNNSLLRFLAQRAPAITEQLSKVMPYGIAGDANDLEQIVNYIKDMYAKQQGSFQSVKTYMNSLSSETMGSSRILSANDISNIIIQLEDVIKNIHLLQHRMNPHEKIYEITEPLEHLKKMITDLKIVLPTTQEMELILQRMNEPTFITFGEPGAFGDENIVLEIDALFKALEKLPKYSQVSTLISKINQYIKLIPVKNFVELQKLEKLRKPSEQQKQTIKISKDNIKIIIEGINNLIQLFNIPDINEHSLELLRELKIYITRGLSEERRREQEHTITLNPYSSSSSSSSSTQYYPFEEEQEAMRRVEGLGIKQKKRIGRPRGSGIVKIPKPPLFVNFGDNEINQHKLENGILGVRRNTRTYYKDMPSKRISQNLQQIIKTIIGGSIPSYKSLGDLDNEEKDYLHKLITRSNLTDRLSVPAPSKDQQEKDIHNFEVLKGQLLSGNDSIELVKKFKLLIRKLSKQGLLPKNDVEDMLELLSDLGY